MTNKITELDYTPVLNRKIINRVGTPGDNLPDKLMQFLCRHYENDNIIIGKRILVIRMLDLAKQYAVKNSVIYITDNKDKYDEFLKAINDEKKYGGDDEVIFIEDWNTIGGLIKDMPKFDCIIGNPPYGDNSGNGLSKTLHFDIAKILLDKYNEKMVFVMPNKIRNSTSKRFDKFKSAFTMLSEITDEGNPFKGFAAVNVGIFVFENHKVDNVNVCGRVYNNLFEITPFTEYENSFMKDLRNQDFAGKFYIPWPTSKKSKRYVRITSIANGSQSGKWFSSVIENVGVFTKADVDNWYSSHDHAYGCVSSDNKNELENIEIAMKNPLLRFGLYKVQDDQSIKIRCYEYIPDIDWSDARTQTDEGILEMAGFSKEKAKEFAKYVKDYMAKVDEEHQPKRKRKAKK